MKTRREILLTHYAVLAKRLLGWVGMVSLLLMALSPMSALASYNQITSRSVTASTSAPSASGTTYTVSFKPGQVSETAYAVGITMCDAPYEVSTTCNQSAGATGGTLASAAFTTTGSSTDFSSGWATGSAANCGLHSATSVCAYDGSGKSIANTTQETLVFTGVTNPSGLNTSYWLNIFITDTTLSGGNMGTISDFGAAAMSTGQTMTVNAAVEESLTFCVGATVNSGCVPTTGGGTVNLTGGAGTCSPNEILTTSNACTGTSMMDANTNASTGYTLQFYGSGFTNSLASHTITSFSGAGATSSPGSEQYGIAGTTESGSGSGEWSNTYCQTSYNGCTANGSKYAYATNTATTIASAAAPTADNVYTVTYLANIAPTTNPGIYQSTINYICTGSF